MYYEEKVIDGILHLRGMPNGEWEPMSPEQLTALVLTLRQQLLVSMPSYHDPWKMQILEVFFDVKCK